MRKNRYRINGPCLSFDIIASSKREARLKAKEFYDSLVDGVSLNDHACFYPKQPTDLYVDFSVDLHEKNVEG